MLGALNNICQPSLPDPEPASAGIDSMIRPPGRDRAARQDAVQQLRRGAGQSWPATDLQCSDMTSLIGNNVAGMVFDIAKSIDRVTITVYQSAAGEGILGWLRNSVDRLITSLGNAIYFPYLALVVHHRRDLAGLAGPDPQARHQDHRGHHLDGAGLRPPPSG